MQELSSKELVNALIELPNNVWDDTTQSATIVTNHQSGPLQWSLWWNMGLRDNRMKANSKPVWQYRLEINATFKVNKEDANLDFTNVASEDLENAKASLEMLKMTGPIIAGAGAISMKHFENGKAFLWKQIQLMQCYFSDLKVLQESDFNSTVDANFPLEFKKMISDQE